MEWTRIREFIWVQDGIKKEEISGENWKSNDHGRIIQYLRHWWIDLNETKVMQHEGRKNCKNLKWDNHELKKSWFNSQHTYKIFHSPKCTWDEKLSLNWFNRAQPTSYSMGNSSSFSRDKAAGVLNSPLIVHLLQRLRMSTSIPSIRHICLHNVHRSNVTVTAMIYSKPLSLHSRR